MTSGIAWVTGGGTGIGKAVAQALLKEGWRVAISGRRAEVLEQAARDIAGGSERILTLTGDAGVEASVTETHRQITGRWGDVDLLVNNAGANPYHTFSEASPGEFEEYFRINCLSAILCARAVLPGMRARKNGAIVNVSSILGKWASATSPAYSISKYALAGFTDALRQEAAAAGVHVMGVYPGFIETPMTLPFVEAGSARARFGKSPESMARAILKGLKRKRRDVLFPWYVPWVLALHEWVPGPLDRIRRVFGR